MPAPTEIDTYAHSVEQNQMPQWHNGQDWRRLIARSWVRAPAKKKKTCSARAEKKNLKFQDISDISQARPARTARPARRPTDSDNRQPVIS